MRFFLSLVVSIFLSTMAWAEDLPKLRVAVLKIGTVNWELATIKRLGLDRENGFELVVQGYAGGDAARLAFAGGEADVVVADWIWTARQRASGKDFATFPYSSAVGGIVVPADSAVNSLPDLDGGKVGIAGGPLDKSWLILRAYAQQKYGMDLLASTEQVFGAPPLIFKTALNGDLDGAINFWHFTAKMKAAGMRQVISVSEAALELGLDPTTPLLGYVFKDAFVAEKPSLAKGFYTASRAAKEILGSNDDAWNEIRSIMNAKSDEQFVLLREDWRKGIPNPGLVDEAAVAKMLSLMSELGGEALVGTADGLPDGTFLRFE